MNTTFRGKFCLMICLLALLVGAKGRCLAEERPMLAVEPAPASPVSLVGPEIEAPHAHRFLDRENRVLFGISAALGAADFAVTRVNLQNGGRELNPLVRPFAHNTAALAVNFAGQSFATVGLSYLFHKTGHHRLERIAPMLNIGASSAAVAYGLTHR